jgi:hypothetical protein
LQASRVNSVKRVEIPDDEHDSARRGDTLRGHNLFSCIQTSQDSAKRAVDLFREQTSDGFADVIP